MLRQLKTARRRGAHTPSAVSLFLALAALALAGPAAAKEVRPPLGAFGGGAPPAFAEPKGLAVDQETHDVYVLDGLSEVQQITVSAAAGQFKLKFGESTTGDLSFDVSEVQVAEALSNVACAGGPCVNVNGGPGDASGSKPYVVRFRDTLDSADVEEIECVAGSTPLSGGSGCAVTTTTNGVNGTINRYHADGTPSNFSGLTGNSIDGRGPGIDQTPQNGLALFAALNPVTQVAIDESGGETDGDIYVTQISSGLIDIFASSGEYLGQLTEYKEGDAATGPLKPLNQVCGVAADLAGNLFVGDFSEEDLIHKYAPTANPVVNGDNVANLNSLLAVRGPCGLAAGAGPTAGFLFANRNNGELSKRNANTGAFEYKISDGNVRPTVDPISGHVLTGSGTGSQVREYDASGPSSATLLRTTLAKSAVTGLAVDGAAGTGGTLYISRAGSAQLEVYGPLVVVPDVVTEGASEVKATTATLNGTISADNGPGATCEFQYLAEASFQKNKEEKKDAFAGASTAACEPTGPFTGDTINAVSGKATGLLIAGRYEFRIVGENANGIPSVGDPESLETAGPPQLKNCSASEITNTAAKISGEINPGALPTTFAVEYVTEAQFDESEYANASTVPVPAKDIGSANGFVEATQPLSGLAPDTGYRFRLRATNEAGTTLGCASRFSSFPVSTGLLDGRAYEMVSPPFKLGEVYPPEPGPRAGLGGTCTGCIPGFDKNKMAMQSSPDGNAVSYEGSPFSGGLASGANEYIAKRSPSGWATNALSKPQYPDTTDEGFKAFSADLSRGILAQTEPSLGPEAPPDFANLYLWQEDGALQPLVTQAPPNREPGLDPNRLRLSYAGANAGTDIVPPFSHVIFQANDALTEAVAGVAPEAPPVGAGETDLYEWSGGELHLVNVLPGNSEAAANAVIGSGDLLQVGGENFNFDHAISEDGSRIFWSERPSGQVYVREGATSTVEIPDSGKFLTATPDGSKVLLSNGIVYDLEEESTADLTGGQGGFQGILGASEDLSRVYFVDTEALTPPSEVNENPVSPEHAEAGEFNLYLSEEGDTTFIGTLLGQDNSNEMVGTWRAAPGNRLAQATADGRFVAFESRASLTGYDNTVHGGGNCRGSNGSAPGCFEVFEYDAESAKLTCPSCNPSGERPLGPSNLSQIYSSREFFAQPDNLPPAGEGRLFFESQDTLTPRDTNGHIQDIYQWEPDGVGDCKRPRGCLELISSGSSPKDSHFINASANGDDVFFDTRDRLVGADKDDLLDLYDARVGGGIAEIVIPPCLGEACSGPLSEAPLLPSPGSASFVGPPDPKRCKKGFVKKHGKCVRKKKRQKQKKQHNKRAAGHGKGGSK